MENLTTFDDWIRQRRTALDLTQAQLAERVGCAVVTIKKIEQATRRPSRQMAELLADALAIPEAQRETFLRMARHKYVEPSVFDSTVEDVPPPSSTQSSFGVYEIDQSTHFVGRDFEMAQLATHLTGTVNGSGRIVFITGEAGRGKTTLMTEFARYALATYPDLIVATGKGEAYAGTGNPYLPFRDILALLTCDVETLDHGRLLSESQIHRLWRLLPYTVQVLVDQSPDLIELFLSRQRLRQRIVAQPVAAAACQAQIGVLAQPQTHSGDVPQRKLFEQYAQVLRALAERQPILLLLDDLQWVDRASADLLFYVARRLAGSRILFLGTYRRSEVEVVSLADNVEDHGTHVLLPLFQELKRRFGDIEIDLGRSTPEMDRAFVDALLDSEPNRLAESFRAELFRRTQGHPLFTVELLHDMQARGDLVRDEQDGWVEGDIVDWNALPARVEAVIGRRIGQLPAMLQKCLKIASVEGDTFTAEVIAHILGVNARDMIQELSGIAGRQHRLIDALGTQRIGNQLLSRYRFVHILFQKYLYGNLDDVERRYLHEAVGDALEELTGEQSDSIAISLAHHFQWAGLSEKAVYYLHSAARQTMMLSAHHEAIAHLRQALHLLHHLPATTDRDRRELQLQTDLGVCYKITKGFAAPEVEQVYLHGQELCRSVGDSMSWACVLWGLHSVYSVRGAMLASRETAQACLALEKDDPVLCVTGNSMLGTCFNHMGEPNSARACLEQALDAYSVEQHDTYIFLSGIDLGVFTHQHLAHSLYYLGYPDQALQNGTEAVSLAKTLSHPFSQASALSYLSMLYQLLGDWRAVQETTENAHRLCIEHDTPYYLAWNTFLQGWAMAERDESGLGISQMERSLANLQTMQTGLRQPYYMGLLAEVYGKAGRVDEGLSLLADALIMADEQEQHLYVPDLHRARGELLWKQHSAPEQIESCFRQAIEVAQQQEAKQMELRATTSLAQLLDRQGSSAEARRVLAQVVDWFNEGSAMADLQAARELLDALS